MDRALVVGGTRFIGRHTVDELLAHGYDVTIFNRGRHANPFATDDRVAHVEGDRTDTAATPPRWNAPARWPTPRS